MGEYVDVDCFVRDVRRAPLMARILHRRPQGLRAKCAAPHSCRTVGDRKSVRRVPFLPRICTVDNKKSARHVRRAPFLLRILAPSTTRSPRAMFAAPHSCRAFCIVDDKKAHVDKKNVDFVVFSGR